MVVAAGLIVLIIIIFIYEFRLRRPDQLVLFESKGNILLRKGRLYPKDLSLVLPKTIHSSQIVIEASAKGNLDVKIKLSLAVSLSLNNIQQFITVGGWNKNAVQKAAKDFEVVLNSIVKEFTEKFEIEELSSEKIDKHLNEKTNIAKEKFGLDIVSVSVQSFEVMDAKIAEAIRQQESARIFEQTETLNQKARIAAAKARIEADEKIAFIESELELKKFDLKKTELYKESEISEKRITEELKRKKLQLQYEKEELELLKNNPELLILTPQAARLAEASQSLKNAKTVVSLSPNDLTHGSELINLFQNFLQNYLAGYSAKTSEKKEA